MQVTFIGHASLLIETQGLTILTDPWWNGPSFGEQWWNYPTPVPGILAGKKLDYIYISHGHHDHLNPDTLSTLSRDATVLVSSAADLATGVREMGFKVETLAPDEEKQLSDRVRVRVIPTHSDDTLLVVADGEEVCIDLNDALHSARRAVQDSFIARLKSLYPKIDYVFSGYGVASHFPNCYRVPGKDNVATAAERQRHFNTCWAHIIAKLDPQFGFPFAADVVFLEEDLFWVNEPTHNAERPAVALRRDYPEFRGKTVDIAPGFQIANGRVVKDVRRTPVTAEGLRRELPSQIARANRREAIEWPEVEALRDLLKANVEFCRSYLLTYPGDYRLFVQLKGTPFGLQIQKQGSGISVRESRNAELDSRNAHVVCSTRPSYLRASLTVPYADEIIFVGSGGIFEYRDRTDVSRSTHRELMTMVRRHDKIPVRADARSRTALQGAKQLVKKLLGSESEDLYDLDRWTVYEDSPATPMRS
jgi:hypothetical protein